MLNQIKKILLFLVLIFPTACFADYGDWDYHGSGRDHPYSAYIDRRNYVGYADYSPIEAGYLEGPLYINSPTNPSITPVVPLAAPLITQIPVSPSPSDQSNEFTVYIPNQHGGINAVVIKKSGDGFIGPQGEYYPEFPKVFQLQMKYGN